MINMIRADLYRIIHGRIWKGGLLFTFLWVMLCGYLRQETLDLRETLAGAEITINFWESFWGYYPVIIPLLVFCCIEYATDFKQKTIKLYIAKGISGWSYYFSKILTGWFTAFVYCVIALIAGVISDVLFYGGIWDTFMNIRFIGFFMEVWIIHATAVTFIVSTVFLMRGSAVCGFINLLLLVYGYFFMHRLELSMGHDGMITRFWLYSHIGAISMNHYTQILPEVVLLFAGYLVVCGLITGGVFHKMDIE